MNPSNSNFIIDLNTVEEFVVTYESIWNEMDEVMQEVSELCDNLPTSVWDGVGRESFQISLWKWILRMGRLQTEIAYTRMIAKDIGVLSDGLRKKGETYVDIIR